MRSTLSATHFPAAMFNAKGEPCWCSKDGCVRCWYANWYYCGDVMRDRAVAPLKFVVKEKPKSQPGRKVRDLGGKLFSRSGHVVQVIGGTCEMRSAHQYWLVECLECGHRYEQRLSKLQQKGPAQCPNWLHHRRAA